MSEKPCTVCGVGTLWRCADCADAHGDRVAVCNACRDAHDRTEPHAQRRPELRPKLHNANAPGLFMGAVDVVCEHGVAMDVHCCGCHSGFIFDRRHVCPTA
jgi:hypothetical protein